MKLWTKSEDALLVKAVQASTVKGRIYKNLLTKNIKEFGLQRPLHGSYFRYKHALNKNKALLTALPTETQQPTAALPTPDAGAELNYCPSCGFHLQLAAKAIRLLEKTKRNKS